MIEPCECGREAEVWYEGGWVLVGCRVCGVAASAFENLKQATHDWNEVAKVRSEAGKFNLHKLVHQVQVYTVDHPEWREGQILFNSLYLLWPEIADEIRATELDPFYDDMKTQKLWGWLGQNKSRKCLTTKHFTCKMFCK